EELRKIRRVVQKADSTAPHGVLLVIDGNTGQNALAQVRAFDDALQLTGLIVTKLDGTAKGGVLAAIAQEKPIPVYFIGVGEKLEDLETFNAREFALALLAWGRAGLTGRSRPAPTRRSRRWPGASGRQTEAGRRGGFLR